MLKKICILMVFIVILSSFAFVALADDLPGIFYDRSIGSTSQFLVSITRPEGDESTFKRSYLVCGNTSQEGIVVQLMRVDEYGNLVPFDTIEGYSQWTIGGSGIFMKEVTLDNGANQIRFVAYRQSDYDNGNLVPGETLQVNDFTVTLLNESLKDKLFKVTIGNLIKWF